MKKRNHAQTFHAGYHPGSVGSHGDAVWLWTDPSQKPGYIDGMEMMDGRGMDLAQIHDAAIFGGYRSCIKTTDEMPHRWLADFRDLLLTSGDPNPDGETGEFGQDGTQWGMHVFGLAGGRIADCRFVGIHGAGDEIEATNEGHATYNTLSIPKGGRLVYENCSMLDCGGHGLYHASSWDHELAINPARAGGCPAPELGGRVVVRKCDIQDVDISTRRGSFAVYLPDAVSDHIFDQVHVVSGIPDGYKDADGGWVNSRGLLGAEGVMGKLIDRNGYWMANPDCDRPEQFMVRGPRVFRAMGSVFDFPQLHINTHSGAYREGQAETEHAIFHNVRGTATVFFNGEEVAQLYMGKPQSFRHSHVSEFWQNVDNSKAGINFDA